MYALIGLGPWGKNIKKALDRLLSPGELIAIDVETDWRDLLGNRDIKAVFIATPAPLHYQMARAFLLTDRDCFVEKPLCLTLSEAEDLAEIAQTRGRILMVGHLLHYHPALHHLFQLPLGPVRYIRASRLSPGRRREHEDALWSLAPHDISVILRLLGEQPSSLRRGGKGRGLGHLEMHFPSGAYAELTVCWDWTGKETRLEVVAERGTAVFDGTRLAVSWRPHFSSEPLEDLFEETTPEALEAELGHFLFCCRERVRPQTDGVEAVNVIRVLEGNYIDATALVDPGAKVGLGSKVWHFSHISGELGRHCMVGQGCYIAPGVSLGDHCRVQNGVSIYNGVRIGRGVFIGPNATFTNDKTPRALYPKGGQVIETVIEDEVTIGANATLVCGIRLGRGAMVGAGAVVVDDVAPYQVVVGNPARPINRGGCIWSAIRRCLSRIL